MTPFLLHQSDEPVKEKSGVTGPGRSLRVILHGKHRQRFMPDAFNGVIIQIKLRNFHRIGQAFALNGIAMILRGNVYPAGLHILNGMIYTPVAKFQLIGFSA